MQNTPTVEEFPQEYGFSVSELQTCIKVLRAIHNRRQLLKQSEFSELLDAGKVLFAPLRFPNIFTILNNLHSPLEKKKRRSERKKLLRELKREKRLQLVKQTELYQKKEKEKNVFWEHVKSLPPKEVRFS